MSSKLNMQDIVDILVANNDISKAEADMFVAQLFSSIEKGLSTDELVKVKDFGSFKLTHIQERESVNVNTQEKNVIPAHRRVTFVPAPSLKDIVNKPFAHFETTVLNEGIFMNGIKEDVLLDDESEEIEGDEGDNGDNGDEGYEGEVNKVDNIDLSNDDATLEADSTVTNIDDSCVIEDHIEAQDEDQREDQNENYNDDHQESVVAFPLSNEVDIQEIVIAPIETIFDDMEEEKQTVEKNEDSIGIDSKEIDTTDDEPLAPISNKAKYKKPKTKGKLRRYILRWDIAIALFMISAIGFAFNYYFTKHNPCEKGIEESEIPKPIKHVIQLPIVTSVDEPAVVADSIEPVKIVDPPKFAKMSPGRTLRLIALDKLGNREFWVYIYMKNKDKIKNPNVVPIGLELELPSMDEYLMDANNPEDVAKAKALGDDLMKELR